MLIITNYRPKYGGSSWFFKDIDLQAESINKISSQNDAVKIEDELQTINKIWPKLNSTQRLAIINLLDRFA
ncbi:hypothetical protein [Cellvibrio sp. PSBB006]|uniref:hypothetical protein n=1 Tax=Cellvibrio sp. PSBB006 TaxID=1987723 RepID=UPI000B3B3D04|nr:hypothetical protein [Cellvibrio sp. PSBB006]ARU28497.1 hypothetical protein CBR65_14195 [Cellvibrio sp. PSBB006]